MTTRTPRSPRVMDAYDLGWLAALIEGEGFIRVRSGSIEMGVNMTDQDVIWMLREKTGVGSLTGPRKLYGNRKPQWAWRCTNMQDVARLLLAIYPLMGQRRSARIAEAADLMCRRTRNPARCGTVTGYNRHRRLGEATCRECRDAVNASQRTPEARAVKQAWRERTGKK